jgi:hypothetical protein
VKGSSDFTNPNDLAGVHMDLKERFNFIELSDINEFVENHEQ